ncbi:HD domain-containing protein [Pseudomonas alloputida]|uniref:HD domain-containing protein n=1 Tax=Pseudomonas TaxID=286 RepID=UPI003EEC2241
MWLAKNELGIFEVQEMEVNTPIRDNLTFWPEASRDPESIEYWLKNLLSLDIVKDIVGTKAFQRLNDISFLGALDYTHQSAGFLKKQYKSRAIHSIYVAALANYIADARGYTTELKNHVIAAALLHDIGHAPLSHSVEPYIKKKIGYGHHQAGEQIIRGEASVAQELKHIIRKNFDTDLLLSLIDATAPKDFGGDLFSSPINIDTIDGITRSHTYLTGKKFIICRISVAKAAFCSEPSCDTRTLDSFWEMKDRVYANLINDQFGLISDRSSELFFHEQVNFSEGEIYSTERSWQQRYKKLFRSFSALMKENTKPNWLGNEELDFTQRTYYLRKEHIDHNRFACNKEKKKITITENTANNNHIQIELPRLT